MLVFALKVLLFTLKATHFDLSYLPRHRHHPHEFSSENGMKLTLDTDMGISFFRERHTLKYGDVHEKFNFLKTQDLNP